MIDGEAPSCFSVTLRRARKQHHCCECPASIMPGEMYEYASGVWDGVGQNFKTCVPCAEVREQLIQDLMGVGYWDSLPVFGHLQWEMSEFYD